MSKSLNSGTREEEFLFLFEAIAHHPACSSFVESANQDLADIYDDEPMRTPFAEIGVDTALSAVKRTSEPEGPNEL